MHQTNPFNIKHPRSDTTSHIIHIQTKLRPQPTSSTVNCKTQSTARHSQLQSQSSSRHSQLQDTSNPNPQAPTMSTHPCPLCDRKLASVGGVQAHLNDKHPACTTCRQHFANDYRAKKHQMTEGHCYCKSHDVFFATYDLHQEHNRNVFHHSGIACVACETNFPSQLALDDHSQGHGHAAVQIALGRRDKNVIIPSVDECRQLRCDDCVLDSSALFVLRGHKFKVKHDPSRHLGCPFSERCDGPFSSPAVLLTHLESGKCKTGMNCLELDGLLKANGPDQHIALASEVNVVATVTAHLKQAQHKHSELNIAQCQCRCAAHFDDFRALLNHIRASEHMVICSCFLTFKDNAAFLSHQRSTGHLRNISSSAVVNPHTVTCRCGLKVRDPGCLEQHHRATGHQGTENAKSPAFCPVCMKTMANSKAGTLEAHMRERHPVCSTCHQVFQYQKDLVAHQEESGGLCVQEKTSQPQPVVLMRQSNHADTPEAAEDVFDLNGASGILAENEGQSIESASTAGASTSITQPTSCASSITNYNEIDVDVDVNKVSNIIDIAIPRSRSSSMSSDDSDGGVLLPVEDDEVWSTRSSSEAVQDQAQQNGTMIAAPTTTTSSISHSPKLPLLLKRLSTLKPLAPKLSTMGCKAGIPF
ncbi:hypothetical protein M409DRAFT_49176 [Zasmidium cellare ATCC 36951]|uniref:C2H2-type domain-containing protein n=1 Tax=Zasmidium cellare ATCC 36951 TaxID=1080233 RepID=A0A6A6D0T3_ZASCE|nr:uncharacterized protein M409DRAFT_49176 [Zasmidium cellare ATCC 36951]KAF2172623.1 hypothetical protein M409DRAFT_49176 [Zasmidium cellare ATCC 36951]